MKNDNKQGFSSDPKAPHNYLKMTARFNKYEVEVLDRLVAEYGINRMNVIRVAFMALAKEKGVL